MLTEKNLSDNDREIAKNLRDAYKLLGELSSSRHPTEADYSTVIHDLFRCLNTLDKRSFDKETGAADDRARTISLFSEKRARIVDAYVSGDFQGVIESCMELKTIFGPDSLTPDIGLLFALSLARKGMLNEAINITMSAGQTTGAHPSTKRPAVRHHSGGGRAGKPAAGCSGADPGGKHVARCTGARTLG